MNNWQGKTTKSWQTNQLQPFQPFDKIVKRIHGILPNLVVLTITVYWFTIFAGSSHVSHYIFFRWRFNVDHCFVRLTCMQRIDGFATIPSSKKHTNHLKYSQQKEECVRETSVLKKKMRWRIEFILGKLHEFLNSIIHNLTVFHFIVLFLVWWYQYNSEKINGKKGNFFFVMSVACDVL